MKNNKKSIIIGAAFIVVALCITGAYMIVTWEPDDSIKPFSAETVSYDNTPSKGNELWDDMIETDAEEIELIEVIYRPEHGSCAFLYDRQEMNHFIKNSGIENLQFGLKEPPALKNMTPQSICIIFHREDVQKIFLKFYSDGVIEKEENGVSLYSSNALDMETFENYMGLLNGNK